MRSPAGLVIRVSSFGLWDSFVIPVSSFVIPLMAVRRPVIPGFTLSLGYSLFYLSLIVLIPLGALALKTTQLSWGEFWETITHPFVVSALKLTFGASMAAAAINAVFGLIVA